MAQACGTGVEARLAARRASTLTQIDDLARALGDIISAATAVATDDEHDPEGQTIAFERAQVASLLHQARSRLADVEWLRRRGVDRAHQLDAEVLTHLQPQRTDLARRARGPRRRGGRLATTLRPTRRSLDAHRRVHQRPSAWPHASRLINNDR